MKKVLVAQFYPALCYSMDCSPPGSSVHGILQARTRGSSWLKDWTWVSCTADRYFADWATREVLKTFCDLQRAMRFSIPFWNRCCDDVLHMNVSHWFPTLKKLLSQLWDYQALACPLFNALSLYSGSLLSLVILVRDITAVLLRDLDGVFT